MAFTQAVARQSRVLAYNCASRTVRVFVHPKALTKTRRVTVAAQGGRWSSGHASCVTTTTPVRNDCGNRPVHQQNWRTTRTNGAEAVPSTPGMDEVTDAKVTAGSTSKQGPRLSPRANCRPLLTLGCSVSERVSPIYRGDSVL